MCKNVTQGRIRDGGGVRGGGVLAADRKLADVDDDDGLQHSVAG